MDTPVLAKQLKLTFINTVDTGCYLEEWSRAMTDRDDRKEGIKGICADGTCR